jgi:hypothetical protein
MLEIQNSGKLTQSFRSSRFNLWSLCHERSENSVKTAQNFRSQFQLGIISVSFRQLPVQCGLDLFSYDSIDGLARSFLRGAPGVSDRHRLSLSLAVMLTHSSSRGLSFLDCVDRSLCVGETSRGVRTRRVLAACSACAESGDARVRRRHAR